MKPLRLRLKGLAGVRSGLGRDELELDLERLAGEAALVAIVGPNGAGKSTLLDNLQPYRLMPSRATGMTPGSFSWREHMSGPEALKELEWEHGGRRYRSTLALRSGKRFSAEAYLHEWGEGRWEPARLPDGTVSDGRAESYDRCLEGILGAPEAFFTSVFSAQGRRPLSAYTNAEIKTLLADLLGIARILEVGAKASETARLLAARLEGLRPIVFQAKSLEEEIKALEAQAEAASREEAAAAEEARQAASGLEAARQGLAEAQAAAQASRAVQDARAALSLRAEEAKKACAREIAAAQADAAREQARAARARANLEAARASCAKSVAEAEAKIAEKRRLLARAEEIRAAKSSVERLRATEAKARERISTLQAKHRERSKLETQRAQALEKRSALEREGKLASRALEELRRRARLAQETPCAGTDLQPRCKLLKDAVEAALGIPEAERRVEELRATWAKQAQEIEALSKAIVAFGDLEAQERQVAQEVEAVSRALKGALELAALESGLSEAGAAIRSLEEAIAGQRRMLEELERSAAAEIAAAGEAASAAARRQADAEDKLKAELEAIEQEAAKLPPAFDASILARLEADKARLDGLLAAAEAKKSAAAARRAQALARIEAARARIESSAEAARKAARIEEEIASFRLLSKAFSADGIVALAIDDAGPEIAGLVNDLLLSCFGPRFTVSIRTQVETAKGELREGFRIEVFDAERGEAKPLAVMSGGERVWVNEALTRGIALYVSRSGGRGYATLFTDEADGPLDPGNKRRFMAMKRKALELGGYEREYFVSQTPELWGMADAVIDLAALG